MAGKFGAASFFLLVAGYNLVAMKVKNFTHKEESITEDTTGLGDASIEHTPVGVKRTTITQSGGFFDTTATTGAHAALSGGLPTTPQATARVVCFGFAGNTAGAPFVGCAGEYTHAYGVMAVVPELTKANAEYRVAGQHERGQVIQPLATQTADWNTEAASVDYTADTSQRVIPITSNSQANPTVVETPVPHGLTTGDIILIAGVAGSDADINGERTVTVISTTTFSVPVNATTAPGTGGSFVKANSGAGGAGYLQVTAASGFSNFVVEIRDSADDITFATLLTFTDNVNAPFAERVAVAGVVDRFLAVGGDVTGSGSVTCMVGFCRA
jgi:hypothetical protein